MKINTKKILWAITTVLGLIFSTQQLHAAEDVNVKQAQSISEQGGLLLDVREPEEYAEIHAPKSTLIPLGQLGARLNEIAAFKDKPVAVMCHSGRRSARAVHLLQEAGYSQVSNVQGGIIDWETAGLKVKRKL